MARDLYAATGQGNSSRLFRIPPDDVFASEEIEDDVGPSLTGMATDPTDGVVYAVTGNASPVDARCIGTIDLDTGLWTLIGALGLGSTTCGDITFDDTGQLFGWQAGPNSRLVSIDKTTGAGTHIGAATADNGGALEFAEGVLYMFHQNGNGSPFYSVDPSTGVRTSIATMSGSNFLTPNCSAYQPELAEMHLGDGNGTSIINLTTGVFVDGVDYSPVASGFDAIVWGPFEPDVPAVVRLHDPPVERFIITDLDTVTLTILDHRATEVSCVFTLDGPSSATGLVAADDPEINLPYPTDDDPPYLNNNTRLIYWLRREQSVTPPYVCRGAWLVMQLDDVAADTPQTRWTAFDPWMYLFSRPVRNDAGALPAEPGITYPSGSRASDIALDLLANTVLVDGDVFIDYYSGTIESTDTLPTDIVFEQGLTVGEAWQRLCASGTIDIVLTPIYDPENRPGVLSELQIYQRAGSVEADAVFGWDKPGSNVNELSRLIDGTQLANKVVGFVGAAGQRAEIQTNAASVTTYGQYWDEVVYSSEKPGTIQFVDLLALAQLELRKNGQRTLTFTPAPERSLMPLRDYGLGDYVAVWASRNAREPIGVDYDAYDLDPDFPGAAGFQRVYGMTIEIDDNGVERVGPVLTSPDTPVGG